ncbi:hypothetical protein [Criibacterium bergeronii]|uniref:Uncharacterized protein n=1 Tax=Criibacterium bergeronii TaxID=1871336 RepID=A0A371IL13_9FIRM|nr:hypothetical protein [Criibacterium bergeronii]RDY21171.1 hypothetical protein BBG48_006515 [Criibacterium bergeronii]
MRKYHIYLTSEERKLIIESLISEKNALISAGKYTDCVDDVLLNLSEQTICGWFIQNGYR